MRGFGKDSQDQRRGGRVFERQLRIPREHIISWVSCAGLCQAACEFGFGGDIGAVWKGGMRQLQGRGPAIGRGQGSGGGGGGQRGENGASAAQACRRRRFQGKRMGEGRLWALDVAGEVEPESVRGGAAHKRGERAGVCGIQACRGGGLRGGCRCIGRFGEVVCACPIFELRASGAGAEEEKIKRATLLVVMLVD